MKYLADNSGMVQTFYEHFQLFRVVFVQLLMMWMSVLLICKMQFNGYGKWEKYFILEFKVRRRFYPYSYISTLYVVCENPNAKISNMGLWNDFSWKWFVSWRRKDKEKRIIATVIIGFFTPKFCW